MIIQAEEMDDYLGRRDGGLSRKKRWIIKQVERWMIIHYTGRRDG